MSSVKGTQTEKNLLASFAGESQARNRYTYFASKAKKEGYVQISDIFAETADQEKEHAKRFFSFLEGGELEITGAFPAGVVGSTLENLKAAAGLVWNHRYSRSHRRKICHVWSCSHNLLSAQHLRRSFYPGTTRQ